MRTNFFTLLILIIINFDVYLCKLFKKGIHECLLELPRSHTKYNAPLQLLSYEARRVCIALIRVNIYYLHIKLLN